MTGKPHIAIIGAGFAGFGASHQLREEGIEATIYEKRPVHGGHTSTHSYDDGYLFDEGPHISFTQNARLQDLFAERPLPGHGGAAPWRRRYRDEPAA